MPLRRRSPEPSPRLLALLQAGEPVRDLPQQEASPADGPWLPHRDWIEDVGRGGRPGHATPGRDGRRAPDSPAPVPPAAPPPGRHRRPRPPGPALLVLPSALRGARISGPGAAIAGMVVVVLVAAAVFGVRVAWARAASAPETVPPPGSTAQRASAVASRGGGPDGFSGAGGGAAAGGGGSAGGVGRASGAPTTPASGPGAGELFVHVVGQVKRPGVVVLAVGARVRDAVAKAGGARAGADLGALNLARPLVDGEQLRVPRPGEAPNAEGAGGAVAPGGGGAGARVGGSGAGGAGGAVNLNTANQAVLEELPGVGPVLAQRIIDWRTEHGRFTSVDELAEVSGIGEKMFAQLQGKVTV